MPNLYIIGGANGVGKTTTAMHLLPEFLSCNEYVNADAIAAGLSPFKPQSVAIQAGRLMIERINALAKNKEDFAFETTLASRSFVPFLRDCKNEGYTLTVIYLWLQSVELAIERVRYRVESGGHDIPEPIIRRCYDAGRRNFINLYLPLADEWRVYDNSNELPLLVAKGGLTHQDIVNNTESWNQIRG